MRIDATMDAFWVLYLMNVLQPVTEPELEAETHRLFEVSKRPTRGLDIPQTLAALVRADMAILGSDGRYAVSVLGLQKLSVFNVGFLRDRNRMFVLKDRIGRL
jgi:hypothetical protein